MVALLLRLMGLLIFTAATLSAQPSAPLQVSIAPKRGSTDDLFLFTVKVPSGLRSAYPVLTGGEDFSITLLGPRVDDEDNDILRYEYHLIPRRTGKLLTPRARIEGRGNGQEPSEPLEVEVLPGETKPVSGKPRDLFLRQVLTEREVYIGEQINPSVEILTSVRLFDPNLSLAVPPGFVAEQSTEEYREKRFIDGREYTVVRYPRILFPSSTGSLQLPSITLQVNVQAPQQRTNTVFGTFSTYGLQQISLNSNAITLQVIPLPPVPKGLSENAAGAVPVGKTSISLQGSFMHGQVGVARQVSVELQSAGNIRSLPADLFRELSGARVYVDQDQSSPSVIQGRAILRRKITFSVVPLIAGTLKVPAVRVLWFDPKSRSYQVAATEPFEAQISPASTTQSKMTTTTQPLTIPTPRTEVNVEPPPAPLQFSPPSFIEQLEEEVGYLNLAFGVSAVVLLPLAAFLPWYLIYRPDPRRQLRRELKRATTIPELRTVAVQALHLLPGVPVDLAEAPESPNGLNSWRAALQTAKLPREEQIFALALLDDLSDSTNAFEELRERTRQLLE
jgi:hypothetical protein